MEKMSPSQYARLMAALEKLHDAYADSLFLLYSRDDPRDKVLNESIHVAITNADSMFADEAP